MMINLSILIVGFGNNKLLKICIDSFYEELKSNMILQFEIVIIENHPEFLYVPSYFKTKPEINWMKSPYNCGFGRANNFAFKHSKGEVILVMNPDIRITAEGIQKLYFNHRRDKEKTISSCKLIYPNGAKQINYYPRINHLAALINQNIFLKKLRIQLQEISNQDIIGFSGALFMLDREIVKSGNLFNPIYFMYEEENDFFYRMKKNGIRLELNEEVTAIHQTEGTIVNKEWMLQQKMISKFQFIRNNFGVFYYLFYLLIKSLNLLIIIILIPFLDKNATKKELLMIYKSYWYLVRLIYHPTLFIMLPRNHTTRT